jgi:hypothetical protein
MWFSVAGLFLDIIGALLLFEYGLPSKVKEEAGDFIVDGVTDQELQDIRKYNSKIRFRAKLGLGLLIAGFVLQLIGTIRQSAG